MHNIQTRSIDHKKFFLQKDQLSRFEFLLKYAVLAPSSHNIQPWMFKINSNAVEIFLNKNRLLIHSDAQNRQAIISIGCAVANLCLAAKAHGLTTIIKYTLENSESLVTININGHPSELSSENLRFLNIITERQNNRSKYTKESLNENFIKSATDQNGRQAKISFIIEEGARQRLSSIILEALRSAFSDKKFTSELAMWLRPSLPQYKDGLVGYNLGIPYLLSFLFPWIVRYLNTVSMQIKTHEDLFKHTPAFGVVTTKDDSVASWLEAGELYERIALIAQSMELATAVLAAPIERDNYCLTIQQLLNTDWRPQVIFRVGRPTATLPHSPRLSIEEVLI